MHQNTNSLLSQEAIRLRVEERRSLREIAAITGASKSSLSVWLRPFPLTDEELRERRKTADRYAAPRKDRGEESKFFRDVAGRELTRQQKAKIAEAAVLFRMVLQGFVTFGSVFDGDKADWMVEVPETGKIHKIQVRWVREGQHGMPLLGLHCSVGHSTRSRYAEGDFDFIVGYDLYSDTAFVYSAEEVSRLKAAVSVSRDHAERWDKLRVP
jgi:hypothetical protein